MRRLFTLLTILSPLLPLTLSAQVAEVLPDNPVVDSLYAAADDAYGRYFTLKANPACEKDSLYGTLLECFMNYMKSTDAYAYEEDKLSSAKGRMRKLRPEFEEAGLYYNSIGDDPKSGKYLECYLNIPKLPFFEGEQFPRSENYAAYVYNVAAESHKSRDFETAVSFMQEYIELEEKNHQQQCYRILAQDLGRLERFDEEAVVLEEALMNYPNDLGMLKQAIMLHTRRNNTEKARELLDRALALAPNDPNLLLHKASVDDENGQFAKALPVYEAFYANNPTDQRTKKRLALCYYNLAGSQINESNTAEPAMIKPLRDSAKENYNKAIVLLKEIVENSPKDDVEQKILFALSDAYQQVGNQDAAQSVKTQAENAQNTLSLKPDEAVPNFNDWYKPMLDKKLAEWEIRGEFEPAEQYVKRVNPESRRELIINTRNELEAQYIREYGDTYNLRDLTIKPYDPDHQTYRIQTRQGDLYLQVPIANDEAKKFKDSWNGVRIANPQFKVDKSGKLLLATADFVTPQGRSYKYDRNKPLEYGKIKIARPEWNDDVIDAPTGPAESIAQNKPTHPDEPINVGESTVDVNIPRTKDQNDKMFALIFANENYKNVENVPFAANDGKSFRRYCIEVLGVPEANIIYAPDATGNEMTDAIDRMKDLESAYEGMRLLVYYSGHGLPDPNSNEAYLLPIDASPRNISTGYKLSRLYKELVANHPKTVTVFLDACFSGAKKDGQVIDLAARGVVITPKEETPTTNMVVFSACTGSETAYPYKNQKHGLFTYFLLKKLQEDKGKTNYKKLADYISTNVKQQSVRLNGKLQTPTVRSALPAADWGSWRFDKE